MKTSEEILRKNLKINFIVYSFSYWTSISIFLISIVSVIFLESKNYITENPITNPTIWGKFIGKYVNSVSIYNESNISFLFFIIYAISLVILVNGVLFS